MFQKLFGSCYLKFMLLLLMTASLGACSDGDDAEAWTDQLSVEFLHHSVASNKLNNRLSIKAPAGLAFTATLSGKDDWCSFGARETKTRIEGQSSAELFVYFKENRNVEARKVTVRVEFAGGESREATFEQEAFSSSSRYDRAWGEQPEYRDDDNFIYKSYFTQLDNGTKARNYSICYDQSKRVSHWVAYPLHKCYTTPYVGRTDAFGFDPNDQMPEIARNVQQNITRSYGSRPGTGRGYDRGHQCASADRQSNVPTNEMTYYGTNMMPQRSSFNQGIWAKLEGKVRDNICSDTLFVVTGTYFADDRAIQDYGSNRVAVPSHCWKVLLRTKSGATRKAVTDCSADELQAIGFWMENRDYPKDASMPALGGFAVSVEEIERKTGFRFFRNLGDDVAQKVKRQKVIADWNVY